MLTALAAAEFGLWLRGGITLVVGLMAGLLAGALLWRRKPQPETLDVLPMLANAATGSGAIRRPLEAFCAELLTALEGCIELSACNVTAARASVNIISNDTRDRAAVMTSLVEQMGAAGARGGGAGVAAAITRHANLFEEFSSGLGLRLEQQATVARSAVALVDELRTSSDDIRRIATAVRLLTLNARIEAAHLGDQGRGFDAISSQMLELSTAVQRASGRLTAMAEGVGNLIPPLAVESEQMARHAQDFGVRIDEETGHLRRSFETAQAKSVQALEISQETAQRTIVRAQIVLANLQFHDRMSQELRRIEDSCKGLDEFVRALDQGATAEQAGHSLNAKHHASFLGLPLPTALALPPVPALAHPTL